MRYNFSANRWVLASMICASMASAQTNRVTRADVECNCDEPLNRFSVSYRMGFNISARFKNLGGLAPLSTSNPGAATPGIDHNYDDGYNRVDISGNFENSTWNWGYENASQLPGNDTLVLSSSSSSANRSSKEQDEDPQHGMELSYNRQLGRIGELKWGVEAAFGFTDVTIHDNGTLLGNVTRISDAYALGGIIPPLAPFHGTYDGPGPLISDIPLRTISTVPGGATISGSRKFDSEIYGMRLGPYLEIPLTRRLSCSLSGGFALLSVNSDFKFRETVTIAGGGTGTKTGGGSHSEFLPGVYFGGNLSYEVCENVNLFAGAQYQAAGTYSHKENGKEAELDLGKSIFVNLGIGFSF